MTTERIDNRSLGDLMAELSRETGTLVRKEVELATTEMTANLREAAGHAGIAAAGGALIHAGLLVALAAFVSVLVRLGVDLWLAAVLVSVVTIVAGYLLMNRGASRLRRTELAPRHTIETLKESSKWTTGQGA